MIEEASRLFFQRFMLGMIAAQQARSARADRNTARLHLLDLFEVLSPEDERLKKARTQLTLLLF